MASTFKIPKQENDELERIKVENTKKIDLDSLNTVAANVKLDNLSKDELKYMLKFGDVSKETKKAIKKAIKSK
jgi:hypothetical protein